MVTQSAIEELLLNLAQAGVALWVEAGRLRSRAAEGVITPVWREQIRLYRDDIITILQQAEVNPRTLPRKLTVRPARPPLSFAQQRLWFLHELGSGAAYNMPAALVIEGKLDVAALQQTLSEIVRRHESLRTTFAIHEGTPYQVIQPPSAFILPVIDLQRLASEPQNNEVKQRLAAESQQSFDLTQDLMVRGQLLQLAEERFVLLLTMHHIAADGWSIGVLVRELTALYAAFRQGQPSPLPPLAIQYADFAVWQRDYLQGDIQQRQLTYWRTQLADAPALLQLPTDRPRPAQQSFHGAGVVVEISADLTQKLRRLSQEQGTTLYMTLLTAFHILLARYTGQADVVVGSPIANRHHQELEPLIGFFVNTLALRCDLRDNPSFLALLAQVKTATQAAYDHQDLPFERLVEELAPDRNLAHNPLVQVAFALQNAPMDALTLSGVCVTLAPDESKTTRLDLELHLWEVNETLSGTCVYATALFEQATIERMMGHFQTLLANIVANPHMPISDLPLLTATERHQLLVEWNNTATDYPKDKTIHQLFEAQVARTPDAIALVMAGEEKQTLTYRDLNQRANQLAHYLQSLGVGPEVLVGICVERSLEMIVGLLAILKAGGAYVPLDPAYPQERLAFILQDAAMPVLLTQAHLQTKLPDTTAQAVCLDSEWSQIARTSTAAPSQQTHADNLAYVIYTSGSTGHPKGVLVAHRGLCNLAQAQIRTFAVARGHRILQVASLNFDASISEIVMALGAGATLVIAPSEALLPGLSLTQTLQQQTITHVTLVPTALALLEPAALPQLQTLIVAGEALPATLAARWREGRRLFNAYGPTESTVCATIMSCAGWQTLAQSPPIGRPIDNLQVYLLDAHRQPVPIGVAGELHIAGVGLARGYLNRPDLTTEKFIANPFGTGKLYKTGDLARWLADGNLEFLGRIDHQVKLRGFRIELGEIEAILNQHPAVQEAVVIACEDRPGDKRLVAYVVQSGNEAGLQGEAVVPATLRCALQEQLPAYMIPSTFVVLEALPLTPNGKVDRKALPAPDSAALSAQIEFVPPNTPTEIVLAGIWSEVLGIQQVGIHDSFFERGGHSLLATQIVSRIRQATAVDLPLRQLFEIPTIAGLADYVDTVQLLQSQQPATETRFSYIEGRL